MQVNIKSEQKKFQPVNLSLIFETEEELHSFIQMAGFNFTVADAVKNGFSNNNYRGKFNEEVLAEILGIIRRNMCHMLET